MSDTPGALMAAEIAEQPQVWRRILDDGQPAIRAAARTIADRSPRFVLFAARGTSDHAALYGKYLVEIDHRLPAGLMSPSSMTVYDARPDLRDVLVVAISQSGGSPDLVQSVRVAREQGATTVALTNAPESALAAEAELHLDVLAGPERSVAATKSYTAQLLVLRLLFSFLRGGEAGAAAELSGLGDEVLAKEPEVVSAALPVRRWAGHHGSGLLLPHRTGSGAEADGDLLPVRPHVLRGRSAARAARHDRPVGPGAGPGAGRSGWRRDGRRAAPAGRAGRRRLRDRCCGGGRLVHHRLRPPRRSARAAVAAAGDPAVQQLALHLAVARGGNPDTPRGLRKVTETT